MKVTLLTCIRKILGLNRSQDTGYPGRFYMVFSVTPAFLEIDYNHSLPNPFHIIIRLSFNATMLVADRIIKYPANINK